MNKRKRLLKNFLVTLIVFISCFLLLRININKQKLNTINKKYLHNINFSHPIYDFEDTSVGGEYISYDLRNLELEKVEFITIIPEFKFNVPIEEQKNVVKLTKEYEFKNIINSFKDFTMKSDNNMVIDENTVGTKMIIKVDGEDFYDVTIIDRTIDVKLNRTLVNVKVYYTDYNYREFIMNMLNNL